MRFPSSKRVVFIVFTLNLLMLLFMCMILSKISFGSKETKFKKIPMVDNGNSFREILEVKLTIVVRKFEYFENDVIGTIGSFVSFFPNVHVLVVSDVNPYPPIDLKTNFSVDRVKVINQKVRLANPPLERDPLSYVQTKYMLFVPDSTRILSERTLKSMMLELKKQPNNVISASFAEANVDCLRMNLSVREWYIEYYSVDSDVCDSVSGKQIILLETETVRKLPNAFMLPFPESLYIQTAAQNIKVKLIRKGEFSEGRRLFESSHAQWKLQHLHQERQQQMFQEFGLKKVVRESGTTEWYGCNRNTPRCFGSVIDDIPEYLWEGKWTPPCCLAGLRQTARHVFARLDEGGVRYWLEGGSLLGAMRSADILPWDYDVDIGLYEEDIPRCPWLAQAQVHPVTDPDGFVWEKALEGNFFRVQFSQINHLHVDLFPFYPRNGTMTKDTWFRTHKQDREFPEYFLHPLSSIEYVGRRVPAPNNIRDFLELKFGKNSIENPEYPNPSRLKFSLQDPYARSAVDG